MKHSKTKALIAALAGLAIGACAKQEHPGGSAKRLELPVVKAQVATIERATMPSRIDVAGVVVATEQASLAPKVMGEISAYPVMLGQSVKKGDLLVKIDAAEIAAKVAQAETQLRQAQRDLQREESLLEKGASTSEIVKNLTDRVEIAQSMLDEAEVMLSYAEIRAPFDGLISRKFADVGSLASPGMPVVDIEGVEGFEIEAGVPDTLVSSLRIEDAFPAEIPASQLRFDATLAELSSGTSSSSRTVRARFAIPSSASVRAGQFARISLSGAVEETILAPVSAVSRLGQMERVFVVEDGKAILRLVKTGGRFGERVEILSGLDGDEIVVVESLQALRDGQPLEVDQ